VEEDLSGVEEERTDAPPMESESIALESSAAQDPGHALPSGPPQQESLLDSQGNLPQSVGDPDIEDEELAIMGGDEDRQGTESSARSAAPTQPDSTSLAPRVGRTSVSRSRRFGDGDAPGPFNLSQDRRVSVLLQYLQQVRFRQLTRVISNILPQPPARVVSRDSFNREAHSQSECFDINTLTHLTPDNICDAFAQLCALTCP